MTSPQIISAYAEGEHNANLQATLARLEAEGAYKDLSTIIIVPTVGKVPTRVVASWWSMYTPPNQRVARLFADGFEVGEAFSRTIESILANPDLSTYKYILTLEHDNLPPPDGIVRLIARMHQNPQFAAIGGLYFTKGPGGVAQIWGDPNDPVLNFRPQRPDPNGGLVECCGTGMGFTAFRLDMFKDAKLRRPWFKTTASATEGAMTQDLYAWSDFRKHGYRCAIDCSIKVGHHDADGKFGPAGMTW